MCFTKHRYWWLIVTLSLLSTFASAQTPPEVRALEPNKPVERELKGGEIHTYSIHLATGQFLHVIVEQRGVDVVVVLFDPEGKQLAEVDSPNGPQGPEPVLLVAKAAGDYRLEVRSLEKTALAGRYEVRIEALRVAKPQDKTEGLASALVAAKTEEERTVLLVKEKELVTEELAEALLRRGKLFSDQKGEFSKALILDRLALRIMEQFGNKARAAHMLNAIGADYYLQGNYAQAWENYQKSFALNEELGNKAGMALTLNNLGMIHWKQGNYAQALEFYQKGLKLDEELGNKANAAKALSTIGIVLSSQGNYDQALEFYQKGLKMLEESGDKEGQTIFFLNSIGIVHSRQGNYALALEFYEKGLRLAETQGFKLRVAQVLLNIGIVHEDLGNYSQASDDYQKALMLVETMGHKEGMFYVMINLGNVNYKQASYAKALEFYQKSLKLGEVLGDKNGISDSLNNLGNVYRLQGNYARALELYRKSLGLREEVGNKAGIADTLTNIGGVNYEQGNYTLVSEFSERATVIARQIRSRQVLWSARTLAGRAYRVLNLPAQARQAFEEAIAIVESLRSNIAGQEARASYFATAQKPYEEYIGLLMQLHGQRPSEGHDAVALQTYERARARSLLEALSEAHADIRQGVEPELLERERTLQQRLNASAERQTRLLTEKHTEEQAAALQKEIDAFTAQFQDIQAQIRQRSPRYAALTQPVPLSVKEIQATVLDADTLLLEYSLGEERSYLWAVTATSINSFELPKRAEIETDVRRAVSLLSDGKQWTTSDKVESEYAAVAGRLSQMLLAPVASELKGKRLLIVGDGALQYLPFGALPSPKSNVPGPTSNGPKARTAALIPKPLMVEHEIVSLPSASTLAVLRRETANRTRPAKSIAVLADPVFERDDERVTASRSTASATKVAKAQTNDSRYLLERAFGLGLQPVTEEGGVTREILRIPRLPFTRREAEAILATAPASEGMKALDFRASRETATNPELAQYRIVHFATHGLLNSEHPELSGIVLSLLNEAGEPVDGFLRLHEIYNLNLPAELVVLSACQTGLGKEIRGEGLVGLTRGFMYAGSPRVVASLWKVSDAATAELMKNFYRGMLKEKMRPAAALRAAQVEMWKQKRWSAPFYWAAFELQGEWK